MKLKNKMTKFFDNSNNLVGLTAYSTDMATILDKYVDFILVGDSLGMTVYGMQNTRGVTLDMMINHGKAVVKGSKNTLVIIDLPYGSYQESPLQAYESASKVIDQTNCFGIKIEGGQEISGTLSYLNKKGINVMGHIGFLPQSFKNYKKMKIKGFNSEEKKELIKDALALYEAGAFSIVIEAVAETAAREVVKEITKFKKKSIPIIGIGASRYCNGQILVTDDMLGLTSQVKENSLPKFVKVYKHYDFELSIKKFCEEVRNGKFPNDDFCYIKKTKEISNVTYLKFVKKK